jgi:hypothetical protein
VWGHVCNHNTWEVEGRRITSSSPAWAIKQNPVNRQKIKYSTIFYPLTYFFNLNTLDYQLQNSKNQVFILFTSL